MSVKNILGIAELTMVLTACTEKQAETPVEVATKVVEEVVTTAEIAVDSPTNVAKETVILEHTEIATAVFTVLEINHETRVVTLENEAGESSTITAGEEAINLDQVQNGNKVLVELMKSISVKVVADDIEPVIIQADEVAGAKKGELAGGGALAAVVVIFKVEEIDLENNTFKLKGVDGEVKQYTAQNPENLTKAKVGDAVVLSIAESVAISLVANDALVVEPSATN